MHNITNTPSPSLRYDEHLPNIDQPVGHSVWKHSTISSHFVQPCTFSEDLPHETNALSAKGKLVYKDLISEDLLDYLLRHNEIISSHIHHLDSAIKNSAEMSFNKVKFTAVKLLLEGETADDVLTYLSRRTPTNTHLLTVERLSVMLECYLLGGLRLLRGFDLNSRYTSLSIELMQFILNLLESKPNYSLLMLQNTLKETVNKGDTIPYVNSSDLPDLSTLNAFICRSGYKKNLENEWICSANLTLSYPNLSILELLSFSNKATISTHNLLASNADVITLASDDKISTEDIFSTPPRDFAGAFASEFPLLNADMFLPINDEEREDPFTPSLDFADAFFTFDTDTLSPINTSDEEVTASSSSIPSLDFLELFEDEFLASDLCRSSLSSVDSQALTPIASCQDFIAPLVDEPFTPDINRLSPLSVENQAISLTAPCQDLIAPLTDKPLTPKLNRLPPLEIKNQNAETKAFAPSAKIIAFLSDESLKPYLRVLPPRKIAKKAVTPPALSVDSVTPNEVSLNQHANDLPLSFEEKEARANLLTSFMNAEPEPKTFTFTQNDLNTHGKKALNEMQSLLVDKDDFSVNLGYLKQLKGLGLQRYYEIILAARCLRYQVTRTQFKQAVLDTIIFPHKKHRVEPKLQKLAKAKLKYFEIQHIFDTNQEHIFPLGKSKQDINKEIKVAQVIISKNYPRLTELNTQYDALRESRNITPEYIESFFNQYIETKETEALFLSLLSDDSYQKKNHETALNTDDAQTEVDEANNSPFDDPILPLSQDFSGDLAMINTPHASVSTEASSDSVQVIDINTLPVIAISDLEKIANQTDMVNIQFLPNISSEKNSKQQPLLTFEPVNNNKLIGSASLNAPASKISGQKRKASESQKEINKIQKLDDNGIAFTKIQGLNMVGLSAAKNNYKKEIAHLKSAIENEYEKDTDKTKFILVKMLLEGIPEKKLFEHFELICKAYQTDRINLVCPERIGLMRDYYFAGGLKLLRSFTIGSHRFIQPASLINLILETIENDGNRSIRTGVKVLEHIKNKMAAGELPPDIDSSKLLSPSSIDRFIKYFGYKKDLKRHLVFNNKLTQPNKV